MNFFNFTTLSLFLLINSVSSHGIESQSHLNLFSRASSNCQVLKTGTLTLVSKTDSSKKFNVGLSKDRKEDSNCDDSTYLTTRLDNVNVPHSKAKFDFQVCKSNYLGFEKKSGKYDTYYGKLFPQGAKKHCLTLRSGEISSTSTLISDSVCDVTDDEFQLLNHFSYTDGGKNKLTFLGYTKDEDVSNNHITIGTSGAVHIYPEGDAPDAELYQFVFV